jgi:hypothetical protein
MLAILLNWTMQRSAGGRQLNSGQILSETRLQLEKGDFNLPKHLNISSEELIKLCQQAHRYGIPKIAQRLSCRSSMESIPAVFRTDCSSAKFDYLSIIDLPRVDFSIKTKDALKKEGLNIPWKMRLFQDFVEVKGIKNSQGKVRVSAAHGRFNETPESLTQFCLLADDQDVEDKLTEILKVQPAFLLDAKEDCRLQGFYTTNSGYLTVGGDAFLAHYISNRRNQL